MSKMKELWKRQTRISDATDQAPRMFGEVFADGQFRGHYVRDDMPDNVMRIGEYFVWDLPDGTIGLGYEPTGEMGIFNKADLEPYIKAFFGLNF